MKGKKQFIRILSICCVVSIMISQLFLSYITSAEATPQLPQNLITEIDTEGVFGRPGEKYNDISDNLTKKLSKSVDISGAECIEFDFYVEDYETFLESLEKLGENAGIVITFSSSPINKKNNAVSADFAGQILDSGWNHIVIDYNDFSQSSTVGNFAPGTLRYWYLNYTVDSDQSNTASDIDLSVINLCVTQYVPETSDDLEFLDKEGIIDTLGESGEDGYNVVENRFSEVISSPLDFSGKDYIQFDIKSGTDNLLGKLISEGTAVYFVLTSSGGEARCALDPAKADKLRNGWMRFIISADNFNGQAIDLFSVTGWKLSMKSDSGATLGENFSEQLYICNIAGGYVPEEPKIYDKVLATPDFGHSVYSLNSFLSGEFYAEAKSAAGDYIRAMLYVSDIEMLKSRISGLKLKMTDSNNKEYEFDIFSFLSRDGWNEIVINTEKYDGIEFSGAAIDAEAESGDLGNAVIKLGSFQITEIPEISIPQGSVSVMETENFKTVWGEKFNYTSSYLTKEYEESFDFSSATWVEFDIYIENYTELYSAYSSYSDAPFFAMYSGADFNSERYSVNIDAMITHSGWNHIQIPCGSFGYVGTGDLNWSAVRGWGVYFNGSADNPAGNQNVIITNICGTVMYLGEDPEVPENYVNMLDQDGKTVMWGDFNTTSGTLFAKKNEPVDMSDCTWVEFDIYIEDLNSLREAYSAKGDAPFFGVFSGATVNDNRLACNIDSQLKQSGWNHIKIAKSSFQFVGAGYTEWEKVCGWVVYFNGSGANPEGDQYVRLTNVCGTALSDPELPDNLIVTLDTEGITGTPGDYYHYTIDRIYREELPAVDFTEATFVEADIYVDDIEQLKKSLSESSTGTQLSFFLSSTDSKDYDGNYRMWCRSNAAVYDQLTVSGWNHISIPKDEFVWAGAGAQFTWDHVTAYGLEFWGSNWTAPEQNLSSANLMIRVVNVCGTGIVADIEADGEKESKPDKEAVYISSADAKVDQNGSWNPNIISISTDYKSEGTASVINRIDFKTLDGNAMLKYLFDYTADMRDIKAVKFDVFVDLPEIMSNGKNILSFVISSEASAKDDYYSWEIKTSGIKKGWNSFTLEFFDAAVRGKPDISAVKSVILRFDNIELNAEKYEYFNIGIDNLRYLPSGTNRTLKINTPDIVTDDFVIEDWTDSQMPDNGIQEDIGSTQNEIVLEPQTKVIKKIRNLTVEDYMVLSIALGIETAVLAAGVVIFILLHKRHRKKINMKG